MVSSVCPRSGSGSVGIWLVLLSLGLLLAVQGASQEAGQPPADVLVLERLFGDHDASQPKPLVSDRPEDASLVAAQPDKQPPDVQGQECLGQGGGGTVRSWWRRLLSSGGMALQEVVGGYLDQMQSLHHDGEPFSGGTQQRRRLKEETIPHIIHQVFLDGEAALEEEERKEEHAGKEFRRFNHRWRNSCQRYHPTWKHMFWDNAAAEALLLERYPWFMDTWKSYPRVVHRGDAIRPFLLHAYGGLYMDVDVECFDSTEKMVDGFDLVLQLEDSGNKSLNNAVMAGAPGLAIWEIMHKLLEERAPQLVAMHNRTHSQRDMSHAVLHSTGPWLLRDAFKAFTGEQGQLAAGYAGEHTVEDTHIMVYALGQWFEPCEWSDLSCHALVDIAAVSGTPLRGIVGHHKNAGTWLKGYEEAPPTPFALRLRLRLRRDTWVTLAMGSSLLVAMAAVLCMRQLQRRRRWHSSHLNGSSGSLPGSRCLGLGGLSPLTSIHSSPELAGLERRSMSHGRPSTLGNAFSKAKLTRAFSHQRFAILSELEKGEA